MITIRSKDQRGHANHGWLDTYHTFSFASYYDPANMGFRALRVINEDKVEPGYGFGMHPHKDMEIVTVVLDGALEHKDTMGNTSVIRPGDVQYMSAGTGVMHSEFNPSDTGQVHLYQIWILPKTKGLQPAYDQKNFPAEQRRDRLQLLASGNGDQDSIRINQDMNLYTSWLQPGAGLTFETTPERFAWLQAVKGQLTVNGQAMTAGDGATITQEQSVQICAAGGDAEFLLFDLA